MKKGLLLSAASLLLSLAVLEGVLRLVTDMEHIRFKCHYPILGNQYCKNVTSVHPESGTKIIINSHGLLDKEYPLQRSPGALRVAVLGDSFVAGEEIEPGSTFHELWEKELPKRLGVPVEVLNFGVSGIGTWKQLQTFHLRVPAFEPDVTVLMFYWGNDLAEALINSKKGDPNPLLDEYPVDSWFERIQVQRKRFNQSLWNHSSLYQFLYPRMRKLKRRVKGLFDPAFRESADVATADKAPNPKTDPAQAAKGLAGSEEKSKKAPSAPKIDTPSLFDDPYFMDSESWQLGKKLLLKLRDEVAAGGGRLVVIHFLSYQQYREGLRLPTQELNAFLSRNSIAFIDPNSFFRELPRSKLDALYIPDDIHLNADGHAFLARVTLDRLAAEIENSKHLSANGAPAH